jgi:D-arabinose 1-dehydrogenase-like Zn-dependent alcohol dehydrogenase
VRPHCVATCDLDLWLVRGDVPYQGPFLFGHEGVAEVTEVGDAVSSVRPGDLVSIPFQVSCGECPTCRRGHTGNCERVERMSMYGLPLGRSWGGFLSDSVRVPFADAMLVPVPEGVEPASIASLSDNIPDGWRTVAPQLEDEQGAPVLICGGAGSIALYRGDRGGARRGARRLRRGPPRAPRASRAPGGEPGGRGVPPAAGALSDHGGTSVPATRGWPARFAPPLRRGSAR